MSINHNGRLHGTVVTIDSIDSNAKPMDLGHREEISLSE